MRNKVIIFDVDDTILDWSGGYTDYVERTGQSRTYHSKFAFSSSDTFDRLKPIEPSRALIKKLHERGNILKIVTSCGDIENIVASRRKNIIDVYGNVFAEIVCLGFGEDKIEYLKKQDKKSVFVDDNHFNISDAIDLGFHRDNCFLVKANNDFTVSENKHEMIALSLYKIADRLLGEK